MTTERDLIGLCLKNRDGFEKCIAAGVSEQSFVDPICGSIFQAMREADRDGKPNDIVVLCRQLGPKMATLLLEISADSPTTLNVQHFADEVVSAAWIRRAQLALHDVNDIVRSRRPHESTLPIRDAVMSALDHLSDGPRATTTPKLARDSLAPWIDDLEDRILEKKSTGITTGFPVLDVIFNGGWHRGSLNVLAARPGVGKTTCALSCAVNAALAGKITMYATLEMSARDMVTKVVSNLARVRTSAFIRGDLSDDEMDRTMGQVGRIGEMPLWLDDAWQGSFEKFCAHCRRIKRRHGLDLVFLDYIGLARTAGRFRDRREEVVEMSMGLKALATELDIAVVVLAQLSRKAEEVETPGKEHIADSDSLGRDPDTVMLLYRRSSDDDSLGEMRVAIAKNRWGLERDIPIAADLAFSAFRSIDVNLEAFRT